MASSHRLCPAVIPPDMNRLVMSRNEDDDNDNGHMGAVCDVEYLAAEILPCL